jgi:ribosomal protein L12E/L44/L45/RPP1/RPP2
LDHWASLPVYNRIPKRVIQVCPPKQPSEIHGLRLAQPMEMLPIVVDPRPFVYPVEPEEPPRQKRRKFVFAETRPPIVPNEPLHREPEPYQETAQYNKRMQEIREKMAQDVSVKAIIAQAAAAAQAQEAAAMAAAAEAQAKAQAAAEKAERKKERAQKKTHTTPEDKEALKEKRLMKLVGAVVVKCMSKHSKTFDRESFKKHAKEVRMFYVFQL